MTSNPVDGNKGGMPLATPVVLGEMVEYAPGAVVSRTLVKRTGGTVTLFAFDAGQGLSEHTAPFDAMVTILDGSAEVTIGGTPVIVNAGQTVLMPAGVPHALQGEGRFKMQLVMIRELVTTLSQK